MSFIAPVPGLDAQTNMASSPQCEQTCFTSCFLPSPLPVPTMVTEPLQEGQVCFSPIVIILTCSVPAVTGMTMTFLHMLHASEMESPGFSASASA